jgi:hypothetical protein
MRVLFLMVCLFSLGGCSIILPPTPQATTPERSCAPLHPTRFNTQATEANEDVPGEPLPLSSQSIEVAKVIDAVPLVTQLTALEKAGDIHSINYIALRQALTERLLLTVFEVSSVTAELVCERDRADQVADRMDEFDALLVKRLTLASIVVGGVAAVVSGGIGLLGGSDAANNAATLAGGVVSSLFGGTALFAASKQQFTHERNLLGELWENPQGSSAFSPAVWRFLQRPRSDGRSNSRDEIIHAWRQQGRLGEPGSSGERERTALIFGKGGTYTSTDLRARASMLETLEAHVDLLAEELEAFLREVFQRRHQMTITRQERAPS